MSFTSEVQRDSAKLHYFIRMSPRLKIGLPLFSLTSGSVYQADIPFSVTDVKNLGVALTAGSSATLSAGQYWYDASARRLYVRKSDSTAISSADFFVVTVRLHFSSTEVLWYSDPTDATSEIVSWDGSMNTPPQVKQGSEVKSFGFYAVEGTAFSLRNVADLQPWLYDMSTRNALVEAWGLSGPLLTSNCQKLLTCIAGDFSLEKNEITFQLFDRAFGFDAIMNNKADGENYYSLTGIGGLDPSMVGAPIRKVFGAVRGLAAANLSYAGGPSVTTSNNRSWGACHSSTGFAPFTVNAVLTAGGLLGQKITFGSVADAQMFRPGDWVFMNSPSAGQSQWTFIISMSGLTAEVKDSLFGVSSGAITLYKRCIQRVYLIQGGFTYVVPQTAFTYADFGAIRGFTLTTNAEANSLSANTPNTFNPDNGDIITCDVHGAVTMPTIGGLPFISGNTAPAKAYSGVIQLYAILKDHFGLAESDINTASFLDADALVGNVGATYSGGYEVGLAVPQTLSATTDFQTYKDVIDRLLLTMMLNAYVDGNGKFSVTPIIPTGSSASSLIGDDVLDYSADFVFTDVSQVRVLHNFTEYGTVWQRGIDTDGNKETSVNLYNQTVQPSQWNGAQYDYVSSNEAKYLHQSPVSKEIQTYLHTGFDTLAMYVNDLQWQSIKHLPSSYKNRFRAIYGDRAGTMRIKASQPNFPRAIFENVSVTGRFLPGLSAAADGTRILKVGSVTKQPGSVDLTFDDLRGVNENSGDFT